jgi:hypothetical protein
MDAAIAQFLHRALVSAPLLKAAVSLAIAVVPYAAAACFIGAARTAGGSGYGGKPGRLAFVLEYGAALLIAAGALPIIARYAYPVTRPVAVFAWKEFSPFAHSPSFPAPAVIAMVIITLASWRVSRAWGLWAAACATLYAAAGLMAGIYWLTDVAVGAIAGMAVGYAARRLGSFERMPHAVENSESMFS